MIHKEFILHKRYFKYLFCLSIIFFSCENKHLIKKGELDYLTIEEYQLTDIQIDEEEDMIKTFEKVATISLDKDPSLELAWGISLFVVNGILEIDNRIIENLHPDLRKGLFEKPGQYDAIARINVTTAGAARISIRLAVPEDMDFLEECNSPSYDGFRQIDLLLAENFKTFIAPDTRSVNLALNLKHNPSIIDALLNPYTTYKLIRNKKNLGEKPLNNTEGFFGKSFYSGLPFKLGPSAMKFGIQALQSYALKSENIPGGEPGISMSGIEQDVASIYAKSMEDFFLKNNFAIFDFVIQIAKDPNHSIDIGDKPWSEEISPYLPVGKFIIPSQKFSGADNKLQEFKDRLQFNPWNQLKAHKPLGPLNRARYELYKRHSLIRAEKMTNVKSFKRCPVNNRF